MSFVAVGLGVSALTTIGGGILNYRAAKKEEDRAREANKKAKEEYNRRMEAYENLDTSNPYLNMENVMEDLTINQKEAEFSRQQFAQSQANIMSGLREAAGGSGIAALAQSLASQGQLASQRAAASIGQQEATNQRAERSMAGQLQNLERKGEIYSRGLEQQKTETLLAMAQQQRVAAMNRKAQAQQAKTGAITGMLQGLGNTALSAIDSGILDGLGGGNAKKLGIDGSLPSDIQIPEGGGGRFLDAPERSNIYNPRNELRMGSDAGTGSGNLSFSEAFRQARASQGANQIFDWRGNPYTTNYDYEVAPGTYGPTIGG